MSDIDLVKKVRGYAEEAEKNGFEVLTVPLRDLFPLLGRMEAAERERDELRKTLQATQGGAAEAIKNVMRLQEEISRLNKESQRLSDQLGACDGQRRDWLKRALTAEAEIARRDAAASGPVAIVREVINGIHVTLYQRIEPGTELYAAPPAVLPPEMKPEPEKYDVIDHGFIAGYNQCRADALALGAQHQKVVELHKRKLTEVISGQRYSYVLLEDLLPELEAAGVKWEVKK